VVVDTSDTTKQLVAPEVLAIILAANHDRREEIGELLTTLPALMEIGWTYEEVLIAVEVGYSYQSHIGTYGRYNWKWRANAQPMYTWLRHHYRSMKGEQVGLSFEQFVAQWRKFVGRGYDLSRERMSLFCYSQRYNIDPVEAERVILRYSPYIATTNIELLRKNVSSEVIWRVVEAINTDRSRAARFRENFKQFVEAYRRGAGTEALSNAVYRNEVTALAHSLRKAQRALQ
jgi:hypothetical protein